MEAVGLVVRVDPVGNLVGRRAGADDSLPPVATGSHVDTVVEGGKYDGALGVLGALETIRLLNEAGIRTRNPLEVIVFTGEEQGGFHAGAKGSRAMVGKLTSDHLRRWRDDQGCTFWEALQAAGYQPERLPEAVRQPGSLHCFVELHIEQGRVLEEAGARLGVVTAIAGLTTAQVEIHGRADHAGATPMGLRHDALAAAAEVVLAVERLAASGGRARHRGRATRPAGLPRNHPRPGAAVARYSRRRRRLQAAGARWYRGCLGRGLP